jgi:Tfp pilus assembly protein PilF
MLPVAALPGLLALLALALLSACAAVPLPARAPAELLPDAEFGPPSMAVHAGEALALSPSMQHYLRERIHPLARRVGPRAALAMALLDSGQLLLEYDASHTRNAAEAFEARAGNCLSLVLMTSALARALDVQVAYQRVDGDASWSRSGDLMAYSGHVNLVLGGGNPGRYAGRQWDSAMVVDFLPSAEVSGHRSHFIDEATVLGMFLNNRAAEALAAGRLDDAYAWVRGALHEAPRLVAAWNTLALVHRRRGDDTRAEQALAQALAAEPDNTRVLANLIGLLDHQGRAADAAPWRARLAVLEPVAPFLWFQRGLDALQHSRWAEARDAFAQELARDPFNHEFHAQMAQAQARLGDLAAVRRHLALARDTSPTPQQQGLYRAKLDRLSALRLLN